MKKTRYSYLIRIYLFTLTCCLLASSASAETVTWTCSATKYFWTTTTCWDSGSVPSAGDDVVFPAALGVTGGANISTDVGTINSLSIEGGSLSVISGTLGQGDLTVATTLSVTPANINTLQVQSGGTLRLQGPVTLESGARVNIIAGGTLQVNDTLTVNTDYFNVYGVLEINGTLLGSTVVTLSSGSTLAGAGGTINITAPGYLAIAGYSNSNWEGSLTNEGEVRLPSSSATINVNNLSFVNNGLFKHLQGGTVNINDSGGSNAFINNGRVEATGIPTTNFSIPFTNNSGGIVLGVRYTSFGATFTNNSGGMLQGMGFDFSNATVTNNGIVEPKHPTSTTSTTTMYITGDFSFGASSVTLIDLGTYYSPTSSLGDKVAVTGTVTLGGTLEVSMLSAYNYNPELGDSWEILTGAPVSGTFDTVNLPTLDSGLEWHVNYSATSVTLQVVEEGATFEDLTITLAGNGSGTVTSAPSGIDCGTTCDYSFQTDTFIILYANADTGSVFTGWSGDCDTHMLTITAATSCTATFELDTDQDGLVDTFEASIGTNPNDPDTDADGYSDYNEVGHGDTLDTYTPGVDTDPNNPDTDGDGYYDGVEAFFWSDPLDPTSISTVICVNTNSDSEAANHHSYGPPSISSDGRYVAFYSLATNLNECDTTAYNDIYLKDTLTGQISVQSTNSAGECLNVSFRSSSDPSISFDSRYVAFESNVDTLTDNDTNEWGDIFLKDTQTNTTKLVSTDSNEVQANDSNETPSVSGDGRYVVFRTSATNLVAEDTDTSTDLILKDTQTGDTTLVSSDSNGTKGNGDSYPQAISYNGRYVVFKSYATNLVADDTNDEGDIFLKDTVTGETTRVSTDSSGAQANGYSDYPAISSDGRYVVFRSYATNLVDNDTNGVEDIFLKDMTTGETTRVSTDSNNTEANAISMYSDISDNGRYVVFSSDATNLIAGDGNLKRDIFVKDMESGVTARVNESVFGVQANNKSDYPVISGDGNFIAFESDATTLVGRCNSGSTDIIRIQNPLIGQTYYELSLTLAGTGSGTVTSTPAGIDCGATCSNDFPDGTLVILSATADQGSVFVGGSGDADCEDGIVTMNSAISCTATFELDSDDDGLADSVEQTLGTNPNNPDTDSDGLNDGAEADYWGTDWNKNFDHDQLINNLLDPDSDNDGLSDGIEVNILGTNPALTDTDGNGTPDSSEDFDLDGFTNFEEAQCGSDPMAPDSKCSKSLPFLMLLLD